MSERPLLFTPENAQKVHVGIKTQTRRLTGLDRVNASPTAWEFLNFIDGGPFALFRHKHGNPSMTIKCPYGVPGDRLWVREAWRLSGDAAEKSTAEISPDKAWLYTEHLRYRGEAQAEGIDKWRSSMMMPRWACRTVLEITEIRVERVREITEEDAKAEGCAAADFATGRACILDPSMGSYRLAFRSLWESINGPDSWEQNPWAWVLTFKKVEGTP